MLLGLAGIMFVIASLIGRKKWRRLYDEERDEYASYAEGADTELRAARLRIAELERDHEALQQAHSDALARIVAQEGAAPDIATTPAIEPVVTPDHPRLASEEEQAGAAEPRAPEPPPSPVETEPTR